MAEWLVEQIAVVGAYCIDTFVFRDMKQAGTDHRSIGVAQTDKKRLALPYRLFLEIPGLDRACHTSGHLPVQLTKLGEDFPGHLAMENAALPQLSALTHEGSIALAEITLDPLNVPGEIDVEFVPNTAFRAPLHHAVVPLVEAAITG